MGGNWFLVFFLVVDAWIVVVIMMIVKLVMFEGRGWCTGGSVPVDVEKITQRRKRGAAGEGGGRDRREVADATHDRAASVKKK